MGNISNRPTGSTGGTPSPHASTHTAGRSDALPWGDIHGYGPTGSRPTASVLNLGYLYFDTTLLELSRSNGTTWDVLTQSGGSIGYGLLSARPVAALSNSGNLYYASDTELLYRSNGSSWDTLYFDWSAISNTPTTVAGYGITDAVIQGAITSSGLTMSTARVLGRSTAGSGAIEEITIGSGLSLSAGTLTATGLGGTVTSIDLALPAEFSISGNPVTTTGTLTGSWVSQTANTVLAAPNGSAGTPSFRALVAADIPNLAASTITYTQTTPADWVLVGSSPTTAQGALDGLAAWISGTGSTLIIKYYSANNVLYSDNLPVAVSTLGSRAVDISSYRSSATRYNASPNAVAFGIDNRIEASADFSVAIGYSNSITQTGTGSNNQHIAIGSGNTVVAGKAGTAPVVALGAINVISGGSTNLVVVGRANNITTGNASNGMFIGMGWSVTSGNPSNPLAVGAGTFTAQNGTAFGLSVTISGANSIAIGRSTNVSGSSGIALGNAATVSHSGSVAIGASAASTAANQVIFGASSARLNLWVTGNTASTSTTTGSGVFEGGVGIAGAVYTGGVIVANSTGTALPAAPTGMIAQFASANANAAITRVVADAYYGTGGGYAAFTGRSARGSVSTPSALQLDDKITHIGAWGYGATGFSSAPRAELSMFAAENWTDTAQGTRIAFITTAPGGVVTSEKVRIWGDGGVQIGGTFTASAGAGTLQVNTLTGTATKVVGATSGNALTTITLGTTLSLTSGTLDVVGSYAPTLTATQVGFGSGSNLLTSSANFTYNSTLATGGLTISNTTASTNSTTGAIITAGGIGTAKSSFFSTADNSSALTLDNTSVTFNGDVLKVQQTGASSNFHNLIHAAGSGGYFKVDKYGGAYTNAYRSNGRLIGGDFEVYVDGTSVQNSFGVYAFCGVDGSNQTGDAIGVYASTYKYNPTNGGNSIGVQSEAISDGSTPGSYVAAFDVADVFGYCDVYGLRVRNIDQEGSFGSGSVYGVRVEPLTSLNSVPTWGVYVDSNTSHFGGVVEVITGSFRTTPYWSDDANVLFRQNAAYSNGSELFTLAIEAEPIVTLGGWTGGIAVSVYPSTSDASNVTSHGIYIKDVAALGTGKAYGINIAALTSDGGDKIAIFQGGGNDYSEFLGQIYASNTTATTSSTTGALIVAGGIGVAGGVYSDATITGDVYSTSQDTISFYGDSFTEHYVTPANVSAYGAILSATTDGSLNTGEAVVLDLFAYRANGASTTKGIGARIDVYNELNTSLSAGIHITEVYLDNNAASGSQEVYGIKIDNVRGQNSSVVRGIYVGTMPGNSTNQYAIETLTNVKFGGTIYTPDITEASGSLGVLTAASILTDGGIASKKKILAQGAIESASTVSGFTVSARSNATWSGISSVSISTLAPNYLSFSYPTGVPPLFSFTNEIRLGSFKVIDFVTQTSTESNGTMRIYFDKASSSTSTGSLVIDGGVGIGKELYVGTRTGTAINLAGFDGSGKLIETSIAVPTVAISTYSETIGDGSTNPITITHSLGTEDIAVSVRKISTGNIEYPTVTVVDSNSISIQFSTAPTTNQYRVTIFGG